ncbi:MAG: efflux RND transporter periplasmic adaptor subunit [Lentisphaeria bacterium]|nr:efflux RND transporter periplasmic adaptor subunit [Lentisphaeria bacterium]
MRENIYFSACLPAILLLLMLLPACKPSKDAQTAKKEPPLPPVRVLPLRQEALTRWLPLTGSVVASNAVRISASIEGPLAFCPFREGSLVKMGDKILEIDRPIYRREVEAAEAALLVAQARLADLRAGTRLEEIAQAQEMVTQLSENTRFAENDLQRIERMVGSGSLPGEALEKAQVAFVKSRSDLQSARERLQMLSRGPTETALAIQEALVKEAAAKVEKTRATANECIIRAPFDAIISALHVRCGDLAVAKTPLMDLYDPQSLTIRFSIPEKYVMHCREGGRVRLVFDALPGQEYDSRISLIYPQLDPGSRTLLAEALPPAELNLSPGMFARLQLAVAELPEALIVPDAALLSMPDGSTRIYVLEKENVARLRKVGIALENNGEVALNSGVKPGDQVIVRGHELLKDGMRVKPQNLENEQR